MVLLTTSVTEQSSTIFRIAYIETRGCASGALAWNEEWIYLDEVVIPSRHIFPHPNPESHMKTLALSILLGVSLAGTVQAAAPELANTVGIGAGIGAQRYYGSYGDQGSIYGRGFLVYNPLEWLGTRLTVGYGDINNDKQNGVDYTTDWFSNAGIDLVFQPKIGLGAFRPYLATGVSTTFGSSTVNGGVNGDLDWNFYIPVELGLEYLITDHISAWAWAETYAHMQEYDKLDGVVLNPDAGYLDRRDDLQKVGVGVTYRFGLKKDADKDGVPDLLDQCPGTPAGVKVDLKGCPLDADKDGVPDFKDKCANTPAGAPVDSVGCPLDSDKDGVADYLDVCPNTPAGVRVDAKGCPLDADKDGVPDFKDKCPNTPVGTKVDAVGCPLPVDSDHDGVTDDKDKCPNTPAGVKVDAVGCPLVVVADADHDGVPDSKDKCPGTKAGDKVDSTGCTIMVIEKGAKLVLDGIVFKTGSAVIAPVSAPLLARAAVALSKAPTVTVEIAGFTDNKGKEATNKKLSQKRAESVKAYLVKLGAKAKQLTAVGYGSAQPAADNKTEAGRAQNRRIEFRVK